ncbi:MAG: 1,4-dihydroxy-2-naphthoate polyprenyltransferase [Flavobacteriales bacterium]|nr:1,4-dihydroxy-2-naphthoate polyprenyltransferase [Flavobacteriales bacterium]
MKHWIHAFRLRTLPLAVSSIVVGSGIAFHASKVIDGYAFKPFVLLLALVTAVLLQVLSNLANDLGDHQHGTDNADRVGPQRAVQSGAISPTAMLRALWICGILAFVSGLALIVSAFGLSASTLIFLILGIAAIGAAVLYTFGSKPYGYNGLGDVSVFLFFGIIGVLGTIYLHIQAISALLLLPAIAFGLFSVGVLNLNNMRDIENDANSGKRTIVVRMGSASAKRYHSALILVGIACLVAFTALTYGSLLEWLYVPVLLLFIVHLRTVGANKEPRALDPQLKVLALGTFFLALAFSLGLILTA